MERVISSTAEACASTLRAVSEAPPRTCSMTIRRSPTAAEVSAEARAWLEAPAATWLMVCAICRDPAPD